MVKEEVEIEWNGQKENVVLKRLTWGEMNQVLAESLGKVRVIGGEVPTLEFDIIRYREALLLKSIVEAPFKIDISQIRQLPQDVGDVLFQKAMELNPFRRIF